MTSCNRCGKQTDLWTLEGEQLCTICFRHKFSVKLGRMLQEYLIEQRQDASNIVRLRWEILIEVMLLLGAARGVRIEDVETALEYAEFWVHG